MKYIWTPKNTQKTNVKKVAEKYNLNPSVAKIVLNRVSESEIKKYLNPHLKYLYSPYEFADMSRAIKIIQSHIENEKNILIYGDYDVDGITGTSLLVKVLKRLNAEVDWLIPNRVDDGYGLNLEILQNRIDKFDLIITVDCGITSLEETKYLKNKNKRVIITDHHLPGKELPKADAILNPKIDDYKYKELAGAGVAYKLACALTDSNLEDLLDLVAVGTVADIVPLLDENRIIVKNGLKNINNKVLIELIKKVNLNKNEIKPAHISFIIGPRINSVGRLADANKIVKLFVEEKTDEISEWIDIIEEKNNKRKDIEKQIYYEARKKIKKMDLNHTYILILGEKEWHPGVIGIVASRIAEKYHRPVLLISKGENETARGSGRSIGGIDLYKITNEFKNLFENLGGHRQAVGFSIKNSNISELRKKLNKKIKNEVEGYDLIPKIKIDSKINPGDISKKLIKDVNRLKPFGYQNPKPLYELNSVQINEPKIVGGNHLKFSFNNGSGYINAICFNMGEYKDYIIDNIDIIGYLEINNYRNEESLQVNVKDIRNHIKKIANIERKNFVHVYNLIKNNRKMSRKELFEKSSSSKLYIDFIIKVFEELGIIFRLDNMLYMNKNCENVSFEKSKIYNYVVGD
ncbi:MAG: single-stranded-DNA-specific exonuclease RecJ [Candidatus Mcinerneyibacterium aminivorans]|uniref:Single-stranded-DNA-specific exonuclease RecJ n=1 Tax=Candidatus Mcinerneyibacterium aminivorans TaxID=2703815 RepID=A0A5D0MEC3_9BACT|nr:MAG: single-stranded-DNA-specific exonuclease RecJ [Candidatus Mcinerneyibacterium aminivorans]